MDKLPYRPSTNSSAESSSDGPNPKQDLGGNGSVT